MGMILVAAAILVLVVLAAGRATPPRTTRHSLPRDLEGAKLFLCEPKDNISTLKPFPLHGRPDEVYLRDGELVVVDTKTRNGDRLYRGDVVKLSAYGAILRNGKAFGRYRVAPYGYVRLVNRSTGAVRFRRVVLLDDNELTAINERRLALRAGRAHARATNNKRLCAGCGQRSKCSRVAA